MPKRLWIAALSVWPGLAQIWTGQELLGFSLAALFAVTLNLAVTSRWIWTESFGPAWTGFFAFLAVCSWLVTFAYTLWWAWLRHPIGHRAEIDRLFREATESYLQGRWQEARQRFERVLEMDRGDADALMQLGTLFVRSEQPALARRAFRQCLEREGGAKWRWEIQQVQGRLDGEDQARS